MIKSYRGILDSTLGNDAQDQLRLKTNKGDIGYTISKFELFPNQPGVLSTEAVVKIYKKKQSSIDALVNFTDGDLIGTAYYTQYAGQPYDTNTLIVTFDNEIFNQDIYVVYDEVSGAEQKMNYYIELEQVPLNDNATTMATLQSLKQVAER